MSADLELIPQWQGKNGVATITAKLGEQVIVVQRIDTSEPEERLALAKAICKGRPGLKQKAIVETLLKIAADRPSGSSRGEGNLTEMLVKLAEGAVLFHDHNQTAYAKVRVADHFEVMKVKSNLFRLWLRGKLKREKDRSANGEALKEAIEEIESAALFDGKAEKVFVRVGEKDGKVYLDLADERWRCVEIDADGWRILDNSPVSFIRPKGQLPLSPPVKGGTIDDLRALLNTKDEGDFVLIVAWLIGCLHPRGPYPLLILNGEQGSAKSTSAKTAKDLIDPTSIGLRGETKDQRDFMITASNGWILCLDNVSHIHGWLSDALCRLATGGGLSARALYSDADETIFDAKRPAILNGIEDFVTRSDLISRCLIVTLSPIPDSMRKTEAEITSAFEQSRPRILGALLDSVSHAIRTKDTTILPSKPRLADFALWVASAELALGWKAGTFIEAFEGNRAGANETAIESSPIGSAMLSFVEGLSAAWEGTARALLAELEKIILPPGVASNAFQKPYGWPKSPKALSNELRRLSPNLREAGIDIAFDRGTDRKRTRVIRVAQHGEDSSEAPQNQTTPGHADGADGGFPTLSEALDRVKSWPEGLRDDFEELALKLEAEGHDRPDAEALAYEQLRRKAG